MLADPEYRGSVFLGPYPERDRVRLPLIQRHADERELAHLRGVDAHEPLRRIERIVLRRLPVPVSFRVPVRTRERGGVLPGVGRQHVRFQRRGHDPRLAQTRRRAVLRAQPVAELPAELTAEIGREVVLQVPLEPADRQRTLVVDLPCHHGRIVAVCESGVGIDVVEDRADKLLLVEDERGVEVVKSLVLLHRLLEVLEAVAGRPRRMEVHVGGDAPLLQLEEQPIEAVEQVGVDALR